MRDGKTGLPGWKYLTVEDAIAEEEKNRENQWGFTYSELMELINLHAAAFVGGDVVKMERIEYRLKDADFNTEARLLHEHEYDDVREIAYKWFLS